MCPKYPTSAVPLHGRLHQHRGIPRRGSAFHHKLGPEKADSSVLQNVRQHKLLSAKGAISCECMFLLSHSASILFWQSLEGFLSWGQAVLLRFQSQGPHCAVVPCPSLGLVCIPSVESRRNAQVHGWQFPTNCVRTACLPCPFEPQVKRFPSSKITAEYWSLPVGKARLKGQAWNLAIDGVLRKNTETTLTPSMANELDSIPHNPQR